jgi:hypothetical protein
MQLPILNQNTNGNVPLILAPEDMEPTEQTFDVTETKVMQLVTYIYAKRGNNTEQTRRDLFIDARTVPKLMNKTAKIA